ncbi:MAG: hypothetical protein ACXWET_06115 [Halobacteriota archaeon]
MIALFQAKEPPCDPLKQQHVFGAVTMLSNECMRDDNALVRRNRVAGPVIQVALWRGLD